MPPCRRGERVRRAGVQRVDGPPPLGPTPAPCLSFPRGAS